MKRRKTVNKYANLNNYETKQTSDKGVYGGQPSVSKKLLTALLGAAMISNIANYRDTSSHEDK